MRPHASTARQRPVAAGIATALQGNVTQASHRNVTEPSTPSDNATTRVKSGEAG
jgi:hypothetical protein